MQDNNNWEALRLTVCSEDLVHQARTLRVQVVLIYGFRYPKRPQSPEIMGTWTLRGIV